MKAGITPLLGQWKGSLEVALKGVEAFPTSSGTALGKGRHALLKPLEGQSLTECFLDAQDERLFVRGALVLCIVSVQRVRRLFGGATAAARSRA